VGIIFAIGTISVSFAFGIAFIYVYEKEYRKLYFYQEEIEKVFYGLKCYRKK